jgi:hypothetical protein
VSSDPFANVEPRYTALLEEALMLLERNARPEDSVKLEAVAVSAEIPKRLEGS